MSMDPRADLAERPACLACADTGFLNWEDLEAWRLDFDAAESQMKLTGKRSLRPFRRAPVEERCDLCEEGEGLLSESLTPVSTASASWSDFAALGALMLGVFAFGIVRPIVETIADWVRVSRTGRAGSLARLPGIRTHGPGKRVDSSKGM